MAPRTFLPVNDDFDDGQDDDYIEGDEDELDPEAMQRGKEEVVRALGERALLLTEKQIEDALWDSFYEPSQAIAFLGETLGNDVDEKLAAFAQVKSSLGEAAGSKVPDTQIRDSLTYYSFDADKTAAYLDRTFVNPTPESQKKVKTPKKAPNVGRKPTETTPKKAAAKKDTTSTPQKVDAATEGLAQLTVAGGTRPKSKNLDVLKEYEKTKKSKKSTGFVVAGHVDSGKSTLMGRLLLELKFVDKHTVDKYRREAEKIGKESFALAWVMDSWGDEREHGVTIDIATKRFETDKTKFTILDAPGHRDFVPNMIAGTYQADFAVLVIDAGTDAFEKGIKGQTYEHVLLLRSIGIWRLVVAVNKMDTVNWSKGRFDEICQQVMGFLSSKDFQQKNVSFVPISGFNGDNVARPSEKKAASWYKGETLIEKLDALDPLPRSLQGPLRLPISERWDTPLDPMMVSGRIEKGSLQVGDAILFQPTGEPGYIKTIMVDDDLQDWAVAGDIVSVSLAGVDETNLIGGETICSNTAPVVCATSFTMRLLAFDFLIPIPVELHRNRMKLGAELFKLEAVLDKETGKIVKNSPKLLRPGEAARVHVRAESKVPLEPGQRVVLRSDGETVAAGLIERVIE